MTARTPIGSKAGNYHINRPLINPGRNFLP
jgi:hypothetical protein